MRGANGPPVSHKPQQGLAINMLLLRRLEVVSPFFHTNKVILSLDTVRVIVSRRNLERVLKWYYDENRIFPI